MFTWDITDKDICYKSLLEMSVVKISVRKVYLTYPCRNFHEKVLSILQTVFTVTECVFTCGGKGICVYARMPMCQC